MAQFIALKSLYFLSSIRKRKEISKFEFQNDPALLIILPVVDQDDLSKFSNKAIMDIFGLICSKNTLNIFVQIISTQNTENSALIQSIENVIDFMSFYSGIKKNFKIWSNI